jgi:lipoyl(octanoyl) transferase
VARGLTITTFAEPVPYRLGLEIQHATEPDTLLLLEHEPVYTRGRRTGPGELPMGEDWYRAQGIEVCEADRGGAVTYHGPGQLVGYPIMRIGNVRDYVAGLERMIVSALADQGVEAEVRDGVTGVWASKGKIGSIGVHVSRGVTTHGFAVNVDNDLQPFEWIVPCGMEGVQMSSICRELGEAGHMEGFRHAVIERFCEVFEREPLVVVSTS